MDTVEEYLNRSAWWHLEAAAGLSASTPSFNSDQGAWAAARQQAITNHLLWAQLKKSGLGLPE